MKITCSQYEKECILEALEEYDQCPFGNGEEHVGYCIGVTLGSYPCSKCLQEHIEWNIINKGE